MKCSVLRRPGYYSMKSRSQWSFARRDLLVLLADFHRRLLEQQEHADSPGDGPACEQRLGPQRNRRLHGNLDCSDRSLSWSTLSPMANTHHHAA